MAYQLLVRAFPFNPAGLPRDIDNASLESDVQSVMTVGSNDVEILEAIVSALCVDVFSVADEGQIHFIYYLNTKLIHTQLNYRPELSSG